MQSNFQRHEMKYLLTAEQYAALKETLTLHTASDEFGDYLVQNLYFDTENWDVINRSIEKPVYKEKMRLRCYGKLDESSGLYLELKKKYRDVVYKRRIAIPADIYSGNIREIILEESSHAARELAFYLKTNPVRERIHISYKRTALIGLKDDGLRITFDADMRYRLEPLDFNHPNRGFSIPVQDRMLMEIKLSGPMPLWLTRALSGQGIFPLSFSKYGICYVRFILKEPMTAGEGAAKEIA